MPVWTVEYIYQDPAGDTRVSVTALSAETRDQAMALAAETAPSDDVVISVQPESPEQLLGSVRHTAREMAGQGRRSVEDLDLEPPDGDADLD